MQEIWVRLLKNLALASGCLAWMVADVACIVQTFARHSLVFGAVAFVMTVISIGALWTIIDMF